MTTPMEFPWALQSAPWPHRRLNDGNVDELSLRVLMSRVRADSAMVAAGAHEGNDAPAVVGKPGRNAKKKFARREAAAREAAVVAEAAAVAEAARQQEGMRNHAPTQHEQQQELQPDGHSALLDAASRALQGPVVEDVNGRAAMSVSESDVESARRARATINNTNSSKFTNDDSSNQQSQTTLAPATVTRVETVAAPSPSTDDAAAKHAARIAERKRRARELAEQEQQLLREAADRAEHERALIRLHDLKQQQEQRDAEAALRREAAQARSLEERLRAAAELDAQRLREYHASVAQYATDDGAAMELLAVDNGNRNHNIDKSDGRVNADALNDVSFEEVRADALQNAMEVDRPVAAINSDSANMGNDNSVDVSFEEQRAASIVPDEEAASVVPVASASVDTSRSAVEPSLPAVSAGVDVVAVAPVMSSSESLPHPLERSAAVTVADVASAIASLQPIAPVVSSVAPVVSASHAVTQEAPRSPVSPPPLSVSPIVDSVATTASPSPTSNGAEYQTQFKLHQVVRVLGVDGKSERGMLAFLGPVDFAPGIWAGVILGAAIGKNDGSVKGRRYFKCDARYGVMVPCIAERLAHWDSSAVAGRVSPHASTAAHVERLRRAQQSRDAKGGK